MLVIAGVFAYIFTIYRGYDIITFLNVIPITLIAVGFGFVFHELAHKFVAIKYGFFAEYKVWPGGLILAIVTALFGFVFAAPGAVYIHGEHITREENGKISIAGPLTNIILAFLFVGLEFISPPSSIFSEIGVLGFTVNSFLALFNLIPFSILDGAKVFKWNPIIWALTASITFLMVLSSMGIRIL